MTKEEALSHFGGSTKATAKALGISSAAVSQWPDAAIPARSALRLKYEVLPRLLAKKAKPTKSKGKPHA